MARHVPLARKNLFQDRRRGLLAVTGVGASLILVLLLGGIFAGAMQQVTAYMRNSPADVFVSQKDVRTMHMSESALPAGSVDTLRASDGVAWAEPLYYTTSVIEAGNKTRLSYVFGYDVAADRAGPRTLARGTPPRAGEVLVDDVAAGELGLDIGDPVTVMGALFRVSGLSTDGTNMANTTVYITSEDFTRLRGDGVAYVLVGALPGTVPEQLATQLEEVLPAATAQTSEEFISQERRIVKDMAADIMQIMVTVGFLIAFAVVGLTLFTTTLTKQREYGVVRALGATPTRLATVVVSQAAWSVALGVAVAVAASVAIGAAVTRLTPNVQVIIETGAIARTATGALVVGAIAALMPLRRVLRIDPATAFRKP